MQIKRKHLMEAKHENVLRLARWLGLKNDLETMSHKQLVNLVLWRLRKERGGSDYGG